MQLLKGPKSAEEMEDQVRCRSIRHLIWLGNTLRHGEKQREMASPDHRNLLAQIGSQDSPDSNTNCSEVTLSNLSSVNFNLNWRRNQMKEQISLEARQEDN